MWRLLLRTVGVKSLVQGLNAAATAGFEPRTVSSEVRRRNRLATAPPLRCLSTSSIIPWCKKVKNDQKLKSRGSFRRKSLFWSLLKAPFKTDLLVKPCEKIQWQSWCKMPSKLLGHIGFSVQSCTWNWPFLCVHFHNFLSPFNFRTAKATCTSIRFQKRSVFKNIRFGVSTRIVHQSGDPVHTDVVWS